MAQVPPMEMEINFIIDAKRLLAMREELAQFMHESWVRWMATVFLVSNESHGSAVIPPAAVERWQRQRKTLYKNLPEEEKDSDRHHADILIATLLKSDFDIGVAGLAESPPFYARKYKGAFHVVSDYTILAGGEDTVVAFSVKQNGFKIARDLANETASLMNQSVRAWFDARTRLEEEE